MTQRWRAPVSFDAASAARLAEDSLRDLGWAFRKSMRERAFEEVVLAVSVPRSTPSHRFDVEVGTGFSVEAYDTRPSAGSLLPYVEVAGFMDEDRAEVQRFLRAFAARAPRPPWRFSFGQRLAVGLLAPEFRRARRAWRGIVADDR